MCHSEKSLQFLVVISNWNSQDWLPNSAPNLTKWGKYGYEISDTMDMTPGALPKITNIII